MIDKSWYAIKVNNKYWLGYSMSDISGSEGGVLYPSKNSAMLVPTDAQPEMIEEFKMLASEHGGQIVKLELNVTECLDEMLKSTQNKKKGKRSNGQEE